MQSLLTLLVAFVLGAFAGGGDSIEGPGEPVAAPPNGPPPSVGGEDTPPPAWVETERGSFWLSYSGFCWGPRCVKMAVLLDTAVPRVVVRSGEVVRFHLGFQAGRVVLAVGRGRGVRLRPGRTVSWRVRRGGEISLFARAAHGEPLGSVGYVAHFKLA